MKYRIFLIGPLKTERARALLEFLAASKDFVYAHFDQSYLMPKKEMIITRILLKGLRIFLNQFVFSFRILIADAVFILPLAKLSKFEILLAKLRGAKIITEFYTSKYDQFVNDRKTVKKNSRNAKRLLEIDKRLIRDSDIIIFLNNSEKNYYLSIIDEADSKLKSFTLPLCTSPRKRANLPLLTQNNDLLTLCWWGTFIPLHGLDKIIQAAKILNEKGVKYKLYLFGSSEEKSIPFKKKVDDLGLNDHIEIRNDIMFCDGSLESFLTENCDFAFGNFGDSQKAKTVMVNKVVEASSMGIPVITQRTRALEEYYEDNKSIFFSDSTPAEIAKKIIESSSNKVKYERVSKNSYACYEKHFSKKAYIKNISEILERELQG